MAILIDPDVFGGAEEFFGDMDDYTDWVKSSPPAPGVDGVLFPGDPERASQADRTANGIPVDDSTWSQLLDAARAVGVPEDEVERIIGT